MAESKYRRDNLPPEQLLDGVPYRNTAVDLKEDRKGPVLWADIRRRWWMRRPFTWFLKYRERKGFRLDTIGFEVWQACDGTHTIEQIVEDFARRHRTSFHEARIVIMQFIQVMTRRELLAVVMGREGESSNETD